MQKLAKVICLQTRRGVVDEQETFSLPAAQAFFKFLEYDANHCKLLENDLTFIVVFLSLIF